MKRFSVLFLFILGTMMWNTTDAADAILGDRRMSQIDLCHIGLGTEISGWNNIHVTPLVVFCIGSRRQWVNFDIGVGYHICMPITPILFQSLLNHHLIIKAEPKINVWRTDNYSIYLGGEFQYAFYLKKDNIGQSYYAIAGHVGARIHKVDIGLKYTYDIVPRYNQQWIYESKDYNFDMCHATIYERMQLGLSLIYYFSFGL